MKGVSMEEIWRNVIIVNALAVGSIVVAGIVFSIGLYLVEGWRAIQKINNTNPTISANKIVMYGTKEYPAEISGSTLFKSKDGNPYIEIKSTKYTITPRNKDTVLGKKK